MKPKASNILVLIAGILLFLVSYNFDRQASLFFKNTKFALLDMVLGIITDFGVVIFVMLLIPSIALYRKNKKLAYLLLTTFLASFVLAFIIKLIVLRQRPIGAFAYPFISILNYSFPSQHSMVVFSLLPALAEYLPRQKSFWIVFAFLVAFSRLYFGLHFLSDIVFGAFAGYFVGEYLLGLHEKGKLWKKKAK